MRSKSEGGAMSNTPLEQPVVAHEEIAIRAYELYLQRGSTNGNDMDDWLAAEQQLARERGPQELPGRLRVPKPEAA